ncbi:hypothetical protein [Pseudomonas sp. UBA6562]|uniref:hypothetical protein n=1 Tax=Pseudomonas sp. UBA6562 TaxID=1947332 RepID=UPI0025F6806F|nr:hypothetical protein [Pseudomonas sp. UBA6562]
MTIDTLLTASTDRDRRCASWEYTFEYLVERLVQCFFQKKPTPDLMQDIEKTLVDFGPVGVDFALAHLMKNEQALADIASRSYLQGNGFYKIVLVENEYFNLRFHLYLEGIKAQENIHSHRWWFASLVTLGTLRSEVWVDSAGIDAERFEEIIYTGKRNAFIPVGDSALELYGTQKLCRGESYVCPTDTLHRVLANGNEGISATLICRAKTCRGWSRNIVSSGRHPDLKAEYLNSESLKDLLNLYVTRSQ